MALYETSKTAKGTQFVKSFGSAAKSVFTGNVHFYIEHKTKTVRYTPGTIEPFTAKYICIGRSDKCSLIYNYEDFPTVSNIHVAIEMVEGKWVLKHLSKTNPTIVNGVVISKEYYLKHADEIQFSFEGPKIKFLIPKGESEKINLLSRTGVMRKQIKAYNKIILPAFIIFSLALFLLIFYTIQLRSEVEDLREWNAVSKSEAESFRTSNPDLFEQEEKIKELKEISENKPIETRPKQTEPEVADDPLPDKQEAPSDSKQTIPAYETAQDYLIRQLQNNILEFASNQIKLNSGQETLNITSEGTGFFLNKGKSVLFVTTRQMIAPWDYFDTKDSESFYYRFNKDLNSSNPKPNVSVEHSFIKNNNRFMNDIFIINTSDDRYFTTISNTGATEILVRAMPNANWAYTNYIPSDNPVNLSWNSSLQLETGDSLYICALGNRGIIIDLCIFQSMNDTIIQTRKCDNLLYQNGAAVVYIQRNLKPGTDPEINIVGLVSGFPDKSFIMPLTHFIKK